MLQPYQGGGADIPTRLFDIRPTDGFNAAVIRGSETAIYQVRSIGAVMYRKAYRIAVAAQILIAGCAVTFFPTEILPAAELEKVIPKCPAWLSAADRFLDACQSNARYFTRTFYPNGDGPGQKEENSAWFTIGAADSHFLMGCTLGRDRAPSFLGIYYTAEPPAIAQANTAPILGIGFDGDVVLSVDGHPVTFISVQAFDTPKVKTRWSRSRTTSLNCQSPLGQDGGYHLMRGNTFADFSTFDSDGTVAIGSFPNTRQRFHYVEFFPSERPRQIIYAWGNELLVTTSGSILVRTDWFPRTCHEGTAERIATSPLLLHQLCRIQQIK